MKEHINTQKRQFCTFLIGEHLFGVDILDVKEINTEIDFTPIFHAPKEVKGYVNIRGHIHLILDLRLLLGFETKKTDEASRLVLFKPDVGESFGILVDRIGDVFEVDETQIEYYHRNRNDPERAEISISCLKHGVCKLKNVLLIILNSENLLKSVAK
ncbi:MAG: hypothetical protein GY795_18495 [Desulfobacterales bacterium]|nr:hypothetical protein [Desulfobacterales bacterium]